MEEAVGKAQSRLAPRTPVPVGVDPAVPRVASLENQPGTPATIPRPLPSESPRTSHKICGNQHCAVQHRPGAKTRFRGLGDVLLTPSATALSGGLGVEVPAERSESTSRNRPAAPTSTPILPALRTRQAETRVVVEVVIRKTKENWKPSSSPGNPQLLRLTHPEATLHW